MVRDAREEAIVTVIIPTVGRPSLVSALKSAQTQTLSELKIIIVDDSSSQDLECNSEFKGQTILKTGGKKGVSYSRNLGILNSNSNWIAFLDDDDIWMPKKLELQISFAIRNSLQLILTSAYVDKNEKSIRPIVLLKENDNPIKTLYSLKSLARSLRYLPMSSVVVWNDKTNPLLFDESLSERENLKYIDSAYKRGYKMEQMRDCLTRINHNTSRSLRRFKWATEVEWCRWLFRNYGMSRAVLFFMTSIRNYIYIKLNLGCRI